MQILFPATVGFARMEGPLLLAGLPDSSRLVLTRVATCVAVPGFACAELLHPLITKVALRIQEPIQWKGGLLCPMLQGKSNASVCSVSRGILVSSDAGKLTHRAYRERAIPHFANCTRATQCGAH